MRALEKYKTISEFINSWLTILAVIAAGLFSINEYLEHKEDERIKRSLHYVERYSADKFIDIRNNVYAKLDEENKALVKALSDSSLSSEELQEKYNKLILDIVDKHSLSVNIKTLFNFHEEVVLCVQTELCDEQVVRNFFNVEALELFRGFSPYVCNERKKWRNENITLRVETFYNKTQGDIC